MGLNGDDQPATIDLLGPLHSSSSVTNDDPPYLKIDILSSAPAEQTHADLPLGKMHTTPAVIMPKTPWKPRIFLRDEVGILLDQGMTEDYDHEPEHSALAKEPSTEVDASLPQQLEVPVWPLDTSSQGSVIETEGSMDSNPICNSPVAVAYSSCSGSPTMDFSEFQADVNMAVNQMLLIKRSSDLNQQWAHLGFRGIAKTVRSQRSCCQ